jgi:hypothetical protein
MLFILAYLIWQTKQESDNSINEEKSLDSQDSPKDVKSKPRRSHSSMFFPPGL